MTQAKHGTIMQHEQAQKMACVRKRYYMLRLRCCIAKFLLHCSGGVHWRGASCRTALSPANKNIGATWNPCDILMSLFR